MQFPVLDEKNVELDLRHGHLHVSLQNNRGRREKREEDLAEHRDCLSSQLYNVTPIVKKNGALFRQKQI